MSAELVDMSKRAELSEMTDREVLNEILTILRAASDALETASKNPMIRAMMPKF